MPAQFARSVITPNQKYVCLSCRLQKSSFVGARTTRHQHTGLAEHDGGNRKDQSITQDAGNDAKGPALSRIRNVFSAKGDSIIESLEVNKQEPPIPKSMPSIALQQGDHPDELQNRLQQKFAAQRYKEMLALQANEGSKASEEKTESSEALSTTESTTPNPKKSSPRAKRIERRRKANAAANEKRTTDGSEQIQSKSAEAALSEEADVKASMEPQEAEGLSRNASASLKEKLEAQRAEGKEANDSHSEGAVQGVQTMTVKRLDDGHEVLESPEIQKGAKKPKMTAKVVHKAKPLSKNTRRNAAIVAAINDLQKGGDRQNKRQRRAAAFISRYNSQLLANIKTNPEKASESLRMLHENLLGDELPLRNITNANSKTRESNEPSQESLMSDFVTLQDALRKKSGETIVPSKNLTKARAFQGSQLRKAKIPPKSLIEEVTASDFEIFPVEMDRPPVPSLGYGLERVLFNPGVYELQDPRSRIYNFDPYLQKIMPVAEFDFNALKEYITSSRDQSLIKIATEQGKRYMGSTSSMTEALAHFHFLLSQWRPINTTMLSKAFPATLTSFTEIQRLPSAIFLRWKNGSYAIDADKQFASANVLSMLGQSMEKMLTLRTVDFERYRKSDPGQVTEDEQSAPQSYHYSTLGDFLMRSQLDAHDSRLPGTGMFDLKTRSVVSIRMDIDNYEHGIGYEIKNRQGEWESYEREYHDMIRAAFLKYSLQVRMGRMDGIFVAYHNIERIFGFQYISLPELDSTLHGQWDTSIGDQEFRLSLALLNKILDRATRKYPEKSIRIHFETREAQTPFMYIFAEPVTEEQVEEIQSHNNAKIQEFERTILGLNRGIGSDTTDTQENDSKWESIRADVQEAMDKDELSIDESGKEQDGLDETAQGNESAPDRSEAFEQDSLYDRNSVVDTNDTVLAQSAGSEEDDSKSGYDGEYDGEDQREENAGSDKDQDANTVTGSASGKDEISHSPETPPSSMLCEKVQREDITGADVTFMDSMDQDATRADTDGEHSPSEDILAMTLTLRNKVNGRNVHRPEKMTAADEWSVDYSLVEVPTQSRARALYKACQIRRSKKMHPEGSDVVSNYVQRLRNLSQEGRAWRKEQDRRDRKQPVQVL